MQGELYVTASEAVKALASVGVTLDMIRDWRRRGLVEPVARLRGRNWYRLVDLADTELELRRSGRGRKRAQTVCA